MAKLIGDLRPVYVVGIGLHPYQYPTETPYIELGLTAIRRALADANIPWEAVESSYIAHALLGMAAGRQMLKYLGALGKPLAHVENASASGSTAVRHAAVDVEHNNAVRPPEIMRAVRHKHNSRAPQDAPVS